MSRRRTSSPDCPLSFNELRVVNAWEATGFRQEDDSAIRAYVSVYGCKRESAKSAAPRLLSRVHVKAEIARRIAATQVCTVETLTSCLVKYRTWAEAKQDYVAASSICMDQAKLAGLLVEKRADVSERPSVDRRSVVEALQSRGLVPSN